MSPLRVLISGASVAGPALAYWLKRMGVPCSVTVVERAARLRTEGQGIDIHDAARDVVKRMGIFDKMRDRSSHEEGIMAVSGDNQAYASFAVDLNSGNSDSITSDIEILRGELAQILYDETKADSTYIFGDTIDSLAETADDVTVHFANGTPSSTFDLVVAADGLGSRVRTMAFGRDAVRIKSFGAYVSYFSVPPSDLDSAWARVHWLDRGRCIVLRPDNVDRTRAFLMVLGVSASDERIARLARAAKEGVAAQKALSQQLFADAGWEAKRILEGMHAADDFYLQHIAQVRMDAWSTQHIAVIGDAGYAPSPFTGMGTSLAFIGAYVLAGEISRQPGHVPAALKAYERVLRPYVEGIQNVPYGVPWFFLPQTRLGVRVLETFIWSVSALSGSLLGTIFFNLFKYVPWGSEVPWKLPEYEAFKEREKSAP